MARTETFAVLNETTRTLGAEFVDFSDAARTIPARRRANHVVVALDAAGQAFEIADVPGRMGEVLGAALPGITRTPAPTGRHLRLV